VVVLGRTVIAVRLDFFAWRLWLEGAGKWNFAAPSTAAKGKVSRIVPRLDAIPFMFATEFGAANQGLSSTKSA
jgi:acyl-CoA hydrolase